MRAPMFVVRVVSRGGYPDAAPGYQAQIGRVSGGVSIALEVVAVPSAWLPRGTIR